MKIKGSATKWAKNPHRAEEMPLTRVSSTAYHVETGNAPMGVMISVYVGPQFDGTSMLVRLGHDEAKRLALHILQQIGEEDCGVRVSVAEQQSDSDCSIENPDGEVTAVRVTRPDSKPVALYVDDRHVTTVMWKKE